jgi:hypothetical protein
MTKPQILPTLDASLAEFNRVNEKHRELCNRRDAIQSDLLRAEMPATTIGSAAVALLSDDPPPDGDPTIDRETLQREESIVAKAIQLNSERLAAAQSCHGRILYASRQDEHRELVAAVVESFERLVDAIQAERAFRDSFNKWSASAAPAIQTASVPFLRHFLQRGIRDTLRRSNTDRFNLPTKKGKV